MSLETICTIMVISAFPLCPLLTCVCCSHCSCFPTSLFNFTVLTTYDHHLLILLFSPSLLLVDSSSRHPLRSSFFCILSLHPFDPETSLTSLCQRIDSSGTRNHAQDGLSTLYQLQIIHPGCSGWHQNAGKCRGHGTSQQEHAP